MSWKSGQEVAPISRERKVMKKRVSFRSVAVASSILAFVVLWNLGVYAQAKPLIVNFSYAQDKIRKGDTWKVYLSVTDPEADMRKVVFAIDEPGGTRYNPSFMLLKKGMEKEFSGYFALHTSTPRNLYGVEIIFTMSILDGKGNIRKTFAFPLEFNGKPSKPLPSEVEKQLNQRIGIIGIDLDIPD